MTTDVFIVGAARTPIGAFMGALGEVSAPRLGAVAIQGALERAGLKPDDAEETYMGNVLSAGVGQAPARQAAIYAGVPHSVPATTVGKVCGSGLQAGPRRPGHSRHEPHVALLPSSASRHPNKISFRMTKAPPASPVWCSTNCRHRSRNIASRCCRWQRLTTRPRRNAAWPLPILTAGSVAALRAVALGA